MPRQAPPPTGKRTPPAARQKRTVLVVGPKVVGDAVAGETVELELTDSELKALVEAGHVTPADGPVDERLAGLKDVSVEVNLQETGAGPKEPPANKKGK